MNPIMKLIVFICLFISFNAHSWTQDSVSLFNESNNKYLHLENPGMVTLWGGVRRLLKDETTKGELKTYKSSLYLENEFTYYLFQSQENSKLTVFFPGVFGEVDGVISPSVISLIEKQPTDVLVIPNFLSLNYIKSFPKYKDFNFDLDFKISVALIKKILSTKDYSKLNFVAESLGTMVAAGSLKEISHVYAGEINSFLMWPPINIKDAINNFDLGIKRTLKDYNQCGIFINSLKIFKNFIWDEIPQNMDLDFIKCMNSYMYHFAFVRPIKNNFKEYAKITKRKFKVLPDDFYSFLESYNPKFAQMIQENPKVLSLSHWLQQRNFKNTKINIVSSQNDFLNKDLNWDSVLNDAKINSQDFYLFQWGSHSGPLGLDIWEEVFKNEL